MEVISKEIIFNIRLLNRHNSEIICELKAQTCILRLLTQIRLRLAPHCGAIIKQSNVSGSS